MKTIVLLLVFAILPLHFFAQDSHEKIEQFFTPRPLIVFEKNIGLTDSSYFNQAVIDYIDEQYQIFHSQIEKRLENGEMMSQDTFLKEYEALIEDVKNEIPAIKPSPVVPPTNKVLNGPCVNMDFEQGDLSGWTLIRGDVDGSAPYSFVNPFITAPGPYHQVFGGGVDPVCGIPTVNPLGGNFSVRLGNGTGVGARAAKMVQTFLVDSTNYLFTYSYAVVFQSPAGHPLNALPYFTVRVYDSLGNNIPCGEYSVIADQTNAPGYQSTSYGGSVVLYKDWESVFVNLSTLLGQNVTVEFTAGDCSYTGHFGYAYVDASCATQEITADQSIICQGDSATLTAPPGAANYLWSNGATTQSTIVYAGGTYTCQLTPFAGGGCSITLDYTISENPKPIADFIMSSPVICMNDTISFLNNSTIPTPGTITSYMWDFGDGILTTFSQGNITGVANTNGTYLNPNHWYTTSGTFTVQLFAQSSDGCVDTIAKVILVNSLPNVIAGNDVVQCEGTSIILSGSGASSYVWDNGVIDNVAFVPSVGTTTYTVIGTDANSCSNTASVDVTVNPLPNVIANANATVLCEGESAVVYGSGASSYVWNNGVIDNTAFIPPVGTTTYTVTGTDANACVNTASVDITVNALPVIIAVNDVEICEGESVVLTATGASTYSWTGGVQNGVSFYPGVGQYTHIVTGTDFNNCQNKDTVFVLVNPNPVVDAGADISACDGDLVSLSAQGTNISWSGNVINNAPFTQAIGSIQYVVFDTLSTGCGGSDTVLVTVHPNPIITAENVEVCDGDAVILYGQGALTYEWTGGVIDGVAFYPTSSDSYDVIGTDVNGCQGTATAKVIVNPNPVADFNWLNSGISTVSPIATFDNLSTGGSIFEWDFNDFSPTSYEFEPVHTFPDDQGGVYVVTLTVTSDKGCVDEIQKHLTVEQDYTIFVPNAFTPDGDDYNEFFKPEMTGFDEYDYTLYIFNRWGELIFESHNMNVGWNGTYASGDYGQSQDGVFTWKILARVKSTGERKQFVGHVALLK